MRRFLLPAVDWNISPTELVRDKSLAMIYSKSQRMMLSKPRNTTPNAYKLHTTPSSETKTRPWKIHSGTFIAKTHASLKKLSPA
eukprot:22617_1